MNNTNCKGSTMHVEHCYWQTIDKDLKLTDILLENVLDPPFAK